MTCHHGHVLNVLPTLDAGSVHCVVTSPPYWGLRDYGLPPVVWPAIEYEPMPGLGAMRDVPEWTGCLGLEPDPWMFVGHLVAVFREVRRVLRDDGTCWLNLGDCYASSPPGTKRGVSESSTLHGIMSEKYMDTLDRSVGAKRNTVAGALKPKDLAMLPNRVALALQADGWWVRSEIVWAKRAPMPESIKDRPTCAHEKVWLLAKSARYWYDAEAVRQAAQPESAGRYKYAFSSAPNGYKRPDGGERMRPGGHREFDGRANLRNVWHLGPDPFPEAHFATFPRAIPERAILAGCPPDGVVLDPFMGSGTTAEVAQRLGRQWVGIEAQGDYLAMQERRTAQGAMAV